MNEEQENLAKSLLEYRGMLLSLARKHLSRVLATRVTAEEIVQDTLSDACQKQDFLEQRPDVPLYGKLRFLLLQQITTLERRHLQSQKRDAFKEVSINDGDGHTTASLNWNSFADTATGQYTHLAREERHALLHKALQNLPENDRLILELRIFDDMPNADCATVLGIDQKASSIRYVRALQRLKKLLSDYTEFRE